MVPDRNPRIECGCQPVAFISSLAVAPPGRFSSSRTLAALLPSRAEPVLFSPVRALGAFFAGLGFLPDFVFLGATWAPRLAPLEVLVAFGSVEVLAGAVSVVSTLEVMLSPRAVNHALHTWIALISAKCKAIVSRDHP